VDEDLLLGVGVFYISKGVANNWNNLVTIIKKLLKLYKNKL